MSLKSWTAPSQMRSLTIGLGLLACIGSADTALADQILGTVNFTLTSNPGAPTNPGGGGPFEMTFNAVGSPPTATLSPATLLSTYGIPVNILAWCDDLSHEITPGAENTGVSVVLHTTPSLLGGLIAEGSLWLNNVTSGINLDAAGLTEFSGLSETAAQIAAVIQDEIWANSGQETLPTSIAGINSTDLATIESDIVNWASTHTAAYISLEKAGLQTQVFAVSVPGPIVGAGLPGLLAACGELIALARRRRKMALA